MEIVLPVLAIIIQIAINIYTIFSLSKLFRKESFSKATYLLIVLLSTISIISCSKIKGLFPLSNTLLAWLFLFISFRFIIRLNTVKSFILLVLDFIFTSLSEITSFFLVALISGNDIDTITAQYSNILFSLILQFLFIFVFVRLLKSLLLKFTKINTLIDNITTKQLSIFLLLLFLCICPQLIIFVFNRYSYPLYFLLINCIQIIIVCSVIFTYINTSLEKDKVESDLVTTKLHNNTMAGMIDGVKTLKHDYNNIMQALNGYVSTKQYDKLQDHINKVLKECNVVNTLGLIDPEIFNDPAIYGIVGAKYFLITEHDITMDLEIVTNIKEINFPMPELSRIFGILLDNAYEATQKCDNPYVKLEMRFDNRKCADIIRIINTYDTNINIDLDNIYKKGVSSKKVKSGIGLWEVKKIISKFPHTQIYPTIEKDKFVQNIIIEKNI